MADFTREDLAGSRFEQVDFTGTRFRNVDLTGAVIRGAVLVNVDIDGLISDVRINGVDVVPLVEAELDRRYPERAKMRPADADGFRQAWEILERLWQQTVARARGLAPDLLHERVDDEWSFIETLRHLVMATDAWVSRAILRWPGTVCHGAVFYEALLRVCSTEKSFVAQCVTCGSELHPERAEKYDYCMAPECQEKNLKSLTMVAVGVNKSAEQYLLLDEETKDELARGKYHDQRRGSFGTSTLSSPADAVAPDRPAPDRPARRAQPPRSRPAPREIPRPWTKSQQKLALLYNEQGKRPDEIAQKLGLSTYLVSQIILSSRNRGKL